MAQFTEQEAKKMKLPLALLNKWDFVMNTLWAFFLAYSKAERKVVINNKENTIFFSLDKGHQFKIFVNFVNSSYLSLVIEIEGKEDSIATINYIDHFGKGGIIRVVSEILTHAEKVR